MKLVLGDMDLHHAGNLIKPALLYGDRVTVYSPAASLLHHVSSLRTVAEPRDQVQLVLEIIEEVPSLRSQLTLDTATLEQFKMFLTLDPKEVRAASRTTGSKREIDEMYRKLEEMGDVWAAEVPEVIVKATASIGGQELMAASDAGLLHVEDVLQLAPSAAVASTLAASLGERGTTSDLDDLVGGFVAHTLEVLRDPGAFPLLDGDITDLVRALERDAGLDPSDVAMSRGNEARAASEFMGFLPNFVNLPIDEVVDLRDELRDPLPRFRAAVSDLSSRFTNRPIDAEVAYEIEDAWRTQVHPSLVDIRESFAEHGLLREAASVAAGDPRRLMAEAGAVFAAGFTGAVSISALMTAGLAAGIPVADVVMRAAQQSTSSRKGIRRSEFYFLHQLGDEARARTDDDVRERRRTTTTAGSASRRTPAPRTREVSQDHYGVRWPLTIASGTLRYEPVDRAIFRDGDGTEYALNGMASTAGYAPIEPIWRINQDLAALQDDGDSPIRINIGPLIRDALALRGDK